MPLQRVLEPEVMDSEQEALDYDQMDHRQVNAQFVSDLLEHEPLGEYVLDLGTGTAQIPVELCQRREDVQVYAVDLAVAMLDLARYNIEVESLIHRIHLQHMDAKQLPYDDAMFDTLISNSIVHHIPEPVTAIKEAVRVTKPGGLVFVRDLARPDSLADLESIVETYAGDENDHQQQMFRASLHAALSVDEIQALVQSLGFASDTVSATSDRHWTWVGRRTD